MPRVGVGMLMHVIGFSCKFDFRNSFFCLSLTFSPVMCSDRPTAVKSDDIPWVDVMKQCDVVVM